MMAAALPPLPTLEVLDRTLVVVSATVILNTYVVGVNFARAAKLKDKGGERRIGEGHKRHP